MNTPEKSPHWLIRDTLPILKRRCRDAAKMLHLIDEELPVGTTIRLTAINPIAREPMMFAWQCPSCLNECQNDGMACSCGEPGPNAQ